MAEQKKTQPVKENVVDVVLQDYLDQLLVTATAPVVSEVKPAAAIVTELSEPAVPDPVKEAKVQRVNKVIDVDQLKPVVEAVPAELVIPVVDLAPAEDIKVEKLQVADVDIGVAEPEVSVEQPPEPVLQQTAAESWANTGVECLLFSVSGLKLAVPLPLLGGVHEIGDNEISPLFGQPDWYLGLCNTEQGSVQVIDTAKFIMPERGGSLKDSGFNYLIQLDKSPWVMGCQSIDDTVRLEASENKWRGDRGKRPWLAGTVIDKMCALLDVSGLLELVESSCKPVRISQN